MFKNNLKISLRNLWNNWGSSLLNITGLTLGVLCSVIIFLTVKYELSFDSQHQNAHEIYRVTNNYYYPTFTMYVAHTPDPMAEALANDFPSFTSVVSIVSSFSHNISVGDKLFESDIIYADADFLEMFDYYNDPKLWLVGNPKEVLSQVNKTILTETLAEKLFDRPQDAIGKRIKLRSGLEIEVGGVIKDPPNNTNYPFEQIVSYPTYKANYFRDSFGGVASTTTFVQIPAAVAVESLQPSLNQFNKKYLEAAWGEDFVSIALQPLSDIHYDERFGSNSYTASKQYLWTLGLIGLFMIIIACINFVNLATAKAISRSKEIGMRKILGSSSKNIITQFMLESSLLAFIAITLGITLAQFTFPIFSELTELNVGNDFVYSPDLLLFITGLLVFITFAIGLYPAFVLSKFKPIEVIRQKFSTSPLKGFSLRRGLMAFQLTTTQVLVIGTIIITCQISFFQNKELGFDKESVLVVEIDGAVPYEKELTFKNKVNQLPFVKKASLTSSVPMSGHHSTTGLTSKDSELQERFNVEFIYVDNDYGEAMNFDLLAGRTAVSEIAEDTIVRGFVVNETLIQRLAFGTPENAIGKNINVHGYEANIIGVVKNFHTLSLHEAIRPVALVYGIKDYNSLGIKYQTNDLQQSIVQVETAWKSVFPNKNFNYYFQDEAMGNMYNNEVRFSRLIQLFTFIAIIIACIGLIGLSAYASVRRFKEIGVRKVLGATTPNILYLMSKEFIVLVIIGFFISIPIAYYLANSWLEGFAYTIQIEWWMIAIGGVLTLILTLGTVSLQSVKVAFMNPIKSLRSE